MNNQHTENETMQKIRAHATRTKRFTRLALLFGFAAIICSLLIVAGYAAMIRPKQKKIMAEYLPNLTPAAPAHPERTFNAEQVQWIMIQANSFSIMFVGVAVGLLGAGTLVNVAIVVAHRTAISDEIRTNLSEMSASLKRLA